MYVKCNSNGMTDSIRMRMRRPVESAVFLRCRRGSLVTQRKLAAEYSERSPMQVARLYASDLYDRSRPDAVPSPSPRAASYSSTASGSSSRRWLCHETGAADQTRVGTRVKQAAILSVTDDGRG